jgi:hypothetical protein
MLLEFGLFEGVHIECKQGQRRCHRAQRARIRVLAALATWQTCEPPAYGCMDVFAVDQGKTVGTSPSHRAVRRAQPSRGGLLAGPAQPRADAAATRASTCPSRARQALRPCPKTTHSRPQRARLSSSCRAPSPPLRCRRRTCLHTVEPNPNRQFGSSVSCPSHPSPSSGLPPLLHATARPPTTIVVRCIKRWQELPGCYAAGGRWRLHCPNHHRESV